MQYKQKASTWAAIVFVWLLILAMFGSCMSARSIELDLVRTWTAPGDDWNEPGNTGGASVYDLRYTRDTLSTWDQWNVVPGLPVPDSVGAPESFSFSLDLIVEETYFFAIRSADNKNNWSERSNVVSLFIPDDIPPNTILDFQ